MGMAVGMPEVKGLPAAVDLAKNPLAETHEFRQACAVCYMKTGEELFFRISVFPLFSCLCAVKNALRKCLCFSFFATNFHLELK